MFIRLRYFLCIFILFISLNIFNVYAKEELGASSNYSNLEIKIEGPEVKINGKIDTKDGYNKMIKKLKLIFSVIAGICSISMVLFFVKNFIALGINAHNPSGRSEALKACLWTGIATALLGSMSLILALSYSISK